MCELSELRKRVDQLEEILKVDSLTLTDQSNLKKSVVFSFKEGVYSVDRHNLETTIDNITNEQNL